MSQRLYPNLMTDQSQPVTGEEMRKKDMVYRRGTNQDDDSDEAEGEHHSDNEEEDAESLLLNSAQQRSPPMGRREKEISSDLNSPRIRVGQSPASQSPRILPSSPGSERKKMPDKPASFDSPASAQRSPKFGRAVNPEGVSQRFTEVDSSPSYREFGGTQSLRVTRANQSQQDSGQKERSGNTESSFRDFRDGAESFRDSADNLRHRETAFSKSRRDLEGAQKYREPGGSQSYRETRNNQQPPGLGGSLMSHKTGSPGYSPQSFHATTSGNRDLARSLHEPSASQPSKGTIREIVDERQSVYNTNLRRRSIHDGNEVEVDVMSRIVKKESVHKFSSPSHSVQAPVFRNPPRSGVSSEVWYFAVVIVVVVCVCIAMLLYLQLSNGRSNAAPSGDLDYREMSDKFIVSLRKMQSRFPSQSENAWKILRVTSLPILAAVEPSSPAVFILVGFGKNEAVRRTTRCLSRRFANVLRESFGGGQPDVELDGKMSGHPRKIKEIIDDRLEEGFSRGSRVGIVYELDALHGEAAMMFHGYCDNENAKHRRVAIIFTLHVDEGERGNEREGDGLVERVLKSQWRSHIDKEQIDPLLSRIGNSNIFVKNESDESLAAMGC